MGWSGVAVGVAVGVRLGVEVGVGVAVGRGVADGVGEAAGGGEPVAVGVEEAAGGADPVGAGTLSAAPQAASEITVAASKPWMTRRGRTRDSLDTSISFCQVVSFGSRSLVTIALLCSLRAIIQQDILDDKKPGFPGRTRRSRARAILV
jgi:hypothetical protein